MSDIQVNLEPTPNPHSMKFIFNKDIAFENAEFQSIDQTARSPLAKKIFGFPWTDSVFIGKDFVTVTKQDWVEWDVLAEPLSELLKEHVVDGAAVLLEAVSAPEEDMSNDSEDVKLIKKVINEEIRPAVAMDGGDIAFHKYENDIVYIYMQGACNGCPSSALTLKQGIEVRIQNALPNVKEVIAL